MTDIEIEEIIKTLLWLKDFGGIKKMHHVDLAIQALKQYQPTSEVAISKTETVEPCDYCSGDKPLTDKIYEDGSKFDDRQGTRIEKFGRKAMLVSYIRELYFDWPMFKNLDKKMLATRWAVSIKFCPYCGRRLEADT